MTPETRYCAECGRPSTPEDLARFGDVLVCPACKERYAQKLREGVARAAPVQYGGFWIRFVAAIIDSIILMVIGGIVQFAALGSVASFPQPDPNAPPEAALGQLMAMMWILGVVFLLNLAIGCTYEALFVSKMSATPGKMALQLKVLRPDGSRLSLGRAAGRYFAKMLSSITLMIGYIIAGFDSQKRALHDMICDTRVFKTQS
jgi:uncharacterized RDD family membrane protein YckC